MSGYTLKPVAIVRSPRLTLDDDDWGNVVAEIELDGSMSEESIAGLETFSHVEVIFLFDRVGEEDICRGVRHPRGNQNWPKVGIFSQRAKDRPNRIGSTICRLLGCEGRRLKVQGIDAVNGTPVLDIKPVMNEFLPREPVVQPQWSRELMKEYWQKC